MHLYQTNKGDEGTKALVILYKRYLRKMLVFFYFSFNNNYPKAQDFVQDLFMKIIEQGQTFNTSQSFNSWIYRIATNMYKNEYRNSSIRNGHLQNIFKEQCEIVEEQSSYNLMIKEAISKMEQEQRALIVLRFKMQMSIKEIAVIYEVPEGTIKSRLFNATKSLTFIYNQI